MTCCYDSRIDLPTLCIGTVKLNLAYGRVLNLLKWADNSIDTIFILLQTSVCALDFFVVVVGVCFFSHTLFPPSYMDISLNTLSVEVRGQI